ncbi:guanylate kinase [Undibacterium amnicola]|jgi:guanylate kinase|uniref:Guanylate kinase n=1 Tax=Undibacterium amnicola TaxID=1834038 RepID=A0ABR6XLH6_9BURK|nr:guanylate kinase [Undibacterium amnicola]MBC3830243.1 guanylate kinase [Undibacterium amnicola]
MPPSQPTSGSLFMVSAPSGAGKSSLVNGLLKLEPQLKLSISFTTRAPRPGEENGREYHFISPDDFLIRKNRGEFLEFAEVHGNYYGTSKILIQEAMRAGTDILLEIDWQGAQQVKKQFAYVASIFILPPSIDALEERLNKRGQDSQEVITRRILAAGGEMAHAPEFEYVIINQDFDLALSELSAIVKATRCRTSQQIVRNAAVFSQLGIQINTTF